MTGTVLTNNGLALITKLVAAKATLEFSRVAVGTGKVPQGVDPQAMISLNAYKMDAQISSYGVSPDQEDVAYIVTQVSSIGVSAGFAVTEGGVFANDPDKGEILFAYLDLTEDPQYVYAETDSISKFVEITFNVLIGSVEKVTAYVTPGALVKKVEFEELEKRVAETENPTFEDYTGDISVPTASAAIEEIKSKSKLGVLLSNIKAAFKGACLIGHIVNNCVTDRSDLPLSAAQGKALMDAITVLNTKGTKMSGIVKEKVYQKGTYPIQDYEKYNYLYVVVRGDMCNGVTMLIPKPLYNEVSSTFSLVSTAKHIPPLAEGFSICAQGYVMDGQVNFDYVSYGSWECIELLVYGVI